MDLVKCRRSGERVPLIGLPCAGDAVPESTWPPLSYLTLDLLFPPIAGEINDTSNDIVLFFVNMARRLSTTAIGELVLGATPGDCARTIELLLDELRDADGDGMCRPPL